MPNHVWYVQDGLVRVGHTAATGTDRERSEGAANVPYLRVGLPDLEGVLALLAKPDSMVKCITPQPARSSTPLFHRQTDMKVEFIDWVQKENGRFLKFVKHGLYFSDSPLEALLCTVTLMLNDSFC